MSNDSQPQPPKNSRSPGTGPAEFFSGLLTGMVIESVGAPMLPYGLLLAPLLCLTFCAIVFVNRMDRFAGGLLIGTFVGLPVIFFAYVANAMSSPLPGG